MKTSLRLFTLSVSILFTTLSLHSQTVTLLHSFANDGTDGYTPLAGPVFDASGNLWGTASLGGSGKTGVVYEIASGQESIIANFVERGLNGPMIPDSALQFDASGNLYGTTNSSNNNGGGLGGTVFEVTKAVGAWRIAARRTFSGGSRHFFAPPGVIFDPSGNLWGVSIGAENCVNSGGSILELTPAPFSWNIGLDFPFGCGGVHIGSSPVGLLSMDASGNFYGATAAGGAGGGGKGTVFEFTPPSTLTYLINFNGFDGSAPSAGVILDSSGNLYGTTTQGGSQGKGNVFELSPNGDGTYSEKILFTFNGANGQSPGALSFDSSGNLYGTTSQGGQFGVGTIFKLTPSNSTWTLTTLHHFGASGDGATPVGSLIFDSLGNLYGATMAGGANGLGTVYEVTP